MNTKRRATLFTVAIGVGLAALFGLVELATDDDDSVRSSNSQTGTPTLASGRVAPDGHSADAAVRLPPHRRSSDKESVDGAAGGEGLSPKDEAINAWRKETHRRAFECVTIPGPGDAIPVTVFFQYDEESSADGVQHFNAQLTTEGTVDPELDACLRRAMETDIEVESDILDPEPIVETIHVPAPA